MSPTKKDSEIMEELLTYAEGRMRDNGAYPFCAFVVKNGVVLSRAFNNINKSLYADRTKHSEMIALSKVNKALEEKHFVVLGEGYELFSTCEPCLACFDSALWADINRFVFSVDHSDYPEYFNDHPYTIKDYEQDNPNEIEVVRKVHHERGVALFNEAKETYGW